jgi:hypothetical protein
MRIAARWIGWYSLAAATAALLAMVVSICVALWPEPPRRVTHGGEDIADLVRTIRHACADQHNADACRRLDASVTRMPGLLQRTRRHHRDCAVACRSETGTSVDARDIIERADGCLACVESVTSAIKSTFR